MAAWEVSTEFSAGGFDDLLDMMEAVGTPGPIIDGVLEEYGGPHIMDCIIPLLPASGRTWRGKKAAASSTQPFRQETASLSVTVKNKPAYYYLYFPDDGSGTKRHQGGQNFMGRGLDAAEPDIIEKCLGALTEAMNS